MERYVIHVTKECNMKCTYCYEKDKTSTYTWEEVKKLIDNIIEYNKDKVFEIEYLGGEPLLAFDIIKKATEYLENQKTVRVSNYAITTNGTILTDEIVQWLKINPKVYWFASMDGTKWMNQFRIFKDSEINSHDVVLKNYKILQKEIGDKRIGMHIVTHPYNIAYLSEGIKHLYDNGIKNIGVGTVESTIIIDKDYCDRFIYELNIISLNICNGIYKDLNIDILNYLKPKTDTRYYIKDKKGKVIGESYGRTKNDITQTNIYNSIATQSSIGTMIENIRENVYYNHQINLANRR